MNRLNTANDIWLDHAYKLSIKADRKVGRNPYVGCVIIGREGHIIGEGYHSEFGGPHAEVNAINNARNRGYSDEDLRQSKLYVTLEPCSHKGKTPPCSDLIIETGIKEVVIGMKDPSSNIEGIKQLEASGVKVRIISDEHAIYYLNRGFSKYTETGQPWVTAKVAMSIDGKMALVGGDSKWISSEKSRNDAHKIRAKSGAIITGTGTVLRDDPEFTARLKKVANPDLYVIGGTQLSKNLRIFSVDDRQTVAMKASPSLPLLKEIADRSNTNNIMLECGPRLLSTFLDRGLVDELVIYQAPFVIGKGMGMAEGLQLNSMNERQAWHHNSTTQFEGDLKTIYIRPESKKFLDG